MSIKKFVLVPVALICLALSACGGKDGDAATGTAASGGDVTVLLSAGGLSQWPSLDPISSGQANADFRNSVFGELFHQQSDGTIAGQLAESYDVSDDGLTVTYHLRDGVTFSDGTPLNADAVVTAYKRALDPANACACATTFSAVTSTEKVDDHTVKVTLSRPMAAYMNAVIGSALNWIPSPTAMEKQSESDFALKPVGAGPFTVTSNDPSQKLVLAKNKSYYAKGEPKLDTLTFQSIGSDQSAYQGLQSGAAQMVEGMTTVPLLMQGKQAFHLVDVPSTGVWMLQFNSKTGALADQRARDALRYATDVGSINKFLFEDTNKPTQTFTASGSKFYEPTIDGYLDYDPAKASALVKEVGGLRVEIMTSSSNVGMEGAQAIQAMWKKAGIESTITQPDLAGKQEKVKTGDWNVLLGFGGAFDPAVGLGPGSFFGSNGPNSGTADPELDTLLKNASAELDETKRAALYHQAWQRMNDKSYGHFMFDNQTYNLVAKSGIGNYDQGTRWLDWGKVTAK